MVATVAAANAASAREAERVRRGALMIRLRADRRDRRGATLRRSGAASDNERGGGGNGEH